MSQKFLRFLLRFSVILKAISACHSLKYLRKDHRQNFQLLIDITCAVAKDELEKHPEMRTIAMVELENNFPAEFSGEVLKCLPRDVAKNILNPHTHFYNNSTLNLPKQTMMIYMADKVEENDTFHRKYFIHEENFPPVHHLSKFLIVSSDKTKINANIFEKLLNFVQIYEENRKVIARSFDMRRNSPNFEAFESGQRENFSQILFPDKTKNLNRRLLVHWNHSGTSFSFRGSTKPISLWTPYFDIIEEKLNATVEFTAEDAEDSLDFLSFNYYNYNLLTYLMEDWCFSVPLPQKFSITELILFLPMDKSCWMWLGLTIAVSTFVWRISESHWGFAFGAFSYFMGQAQLIIRIRTNRLTMKILLQLWILTIFIFSNGYQSIVTSFMLNPMQQKLLTTVDEVIEGDFKFEKEYEDYFRSMTKFQKVEDDRFVWLEGDEETRQRKFIELNVAFYYGCDAMKNGIENGGDGKTCDGFYLIPEAVFSLRVDLSPRLFHPYLDKFQELMDQTFEVGLYQAWKRFLWEKVTEEYSAEGRRRKLPEDGNGILDFKLIAPFFLILAFGFSAALVALLCEIFWHDVVKELTREYFKRKKEEIFKRKFDEIFKSRTGKANLRKVRRGKVQKRKLKVKKIQVRPRRNRTAPV